MVPHRIDHSGFRNRSRTGSVVGALVAFLLLGAPLSAQADAVIEAEEIGGNVVFTASGSLNVDEWTDPQPNATDTARIDADQVVIVGPNDVTEVDRLLTAPANFDGPFFIGTGLDQTTPSFSGSSGDVFGIDFGNAELVVPRGYVSGELLRSTSTYVAKTFASLGIEVGTYTWTWGSGDTADSLTLIVSDGTETCEDELDRLTADEDGDGLYDQFDRCPGTPAGEEIDTAGCSLYQFCENAGGGKRRLCSFADWQNDEPGRPKDCTSRDGACRPR